MWHFSTVWNFMPQKEQTRSAVDEEEDGEATAAAATTDGTCTRRADLTCVLLQQYRFFDRKIVDLREKRQRRRKRLELGRGKSTDKSHGGEVAVEVVQRVELRACILARIESVFNTRDEHREGFVLFFDDSEERRIRVEASGRTLEFVNGFEECPHLNGVFFKALDVYTLVALEVGEYKTSSFSPLGFP